MYSKQNKFQKFLAENGSVRSNPSHLKSRNNPGSDATTRKWANSWDKQGLADGNRQKTAMEN